MPSISDGHVIPALTRWTEMADVDRSYAFVLRVFYDSKDMNAGRLYGANRLTVGTSNTRTSTQPMTLNATTRATQRHTDKSHHSTVINHFSIVMMQY